MHVNWYDHFLFALLGIVIPFMSFQSKINQDETDIPLELPPKNHLYLNNLFLLFIGMLLCLTAWHANENDWNTLGFQKILLTPSGLLAAGALITLYVADGVFQVISYRKNPDSFQDLEKIIPVNWKEYLSFMPLAVMAGISEEIIYRAYLFHYLVSFSPEDNWAPFLAIIITSTGFSISHLYQGWVAVMKIFIIALLFGLMYWYTKSLIGVIIIHISIDLISGTSGIFLKKSAKNNTQTLE